MGGALVNCDRADSGPILGYLVTVFALLMLLLA